MCRILRCGVDHRGERTHAGPKARSSPSTHGIGRSCVGTKSPAVVLRTSDFKPWQLDCSISKPVGNASAEALTVQHRPERRQPVSEDARIELQNPRNIFEAPKLFRNFVRCSPQNVLDCREPHRPQTARVRTSHESQAPAVLVPVENNTYDDCAD